MSGKTLEMARKKPSQSESDPTPAKETDTIRVDRDLARRITMIATRRNVSVSDLVSPLLKPKIDELYRQMVREMNDEIGG